MLSDQVNTTAGLGFLTLNIETDTSIQGVLNCLNLNLPLFAKKQKGKIKMNEDGLTQRLCRFLNRNIGSFPFLFEKEDMENDEKGNSPRVDIGIVSNTETIIVNDREFTEDETFFKIEAKRLGKLPKIREKEYVVGREDKEGKYINSGGIERFKKGIHGKNLIHAAIIGYVQLHDFKHWHKSINSWITGLSKETPAFWSNKELLKNESAKSELATYTSHHLREKESIKDEIKLNHFWVDLQ
jgi:hypothetical protein